MFNISKEKIAYKGNRRGYIFTATYLKEPEGEALIEIEKDDKLLRTFLFPDYKIYNIAAHADDIIDGLEQDNDSGLLIAGYDCLGGNSYHG